MKSHFKEKFHKFKYSIMTVLLVLSVIVYIFLMEKIQLSYSHLKGDTPIKYIEVPWLRTPPDKVYFVKLGNVLHETSQRFLSFSIDSSEIQRGLRNPSLRDERLIKIMSHLNGGYIRVGGNAADLLIFTLGFRKWSDNYYPTDGGECSFENINCSEYLKMKNFSMSAGNWVDINTFVRKAGFKLLFDLNVLLRNEKGWNQENAELLMDISYGYMYQIDWQLGNEPNAFMHKFNRVVAPEDLAKDFNTLRRLLNRYRIYETSVLVGPDVTTRTDYLKKFAALNPNVNAYSFHHYYTGPNATLDDYLDLQTYNSFKRICQLMIKIVKTDPVKQIWLTETGSSYGGGVLELSNTFVSSLLWSDKLGLAARENISLIVRHSIYEGHYSLIDRFTWEPNPDYWISILYKKLIGSKVLKVMKKEIDGTLRLYGHCTKDKHPVIFGLNIANSTQGIFLKLESHGELYSLTSTDHLSRSVYLNGRRLLLTNAHELPQMRPILVSLEKVLPVLPYSIFFLEIKKQLPNCDSYFSVNR